MIEKLRSIAIFATVVEQGSFRAAAQHLGLAPSRVSQAVSDLEADLAVTLLYRSTRRLSLSNEGRVLHDKARAMLDAAESGLDAISSLSEDPRGELRITAPAFVTQTGLMDAFAAFCAQHPNILLRFSFSDHPHNLIKEGFDLGIRAGRREDSELLTRKIGGTKRQLVASPSYVGSKPAPSHPRDLEHWDWIRFAMRSDQTHFRSKDGETTAVLGKASLSVDSAVALYEFAVRGMGLATIPEHLARLALERGELVPVLPEWPLDPLSLYAMWPDRSRRENLTLLFVRFLAERANAKDTASSPL